VPSDLGGLPSGNITNDYLKLLRKTLRLKWTRRIAQMDCGRKTATMRWRARRRQYRPSQLALRTASVPDSDLGRRDYPRRRRRERH
jgi:hypothetical protein